MKWTLGLLKKSPTADQGAPRTLMNVCGSRKRLKAFLSSQMVGWGEVMRKNSREKDRQATSTSFMWAYRSGEDSDEPIVLLDYQPGRGQVYGRSSTEWGRGWRSWSVLLCQDLADRIIEGKRSLQHGVAGGFEDIRFLPSPLPMLRLNGSPMIRMNPALFTALQDRVIPTVFECDSYEDSHQPTNLNLWRKLEVCDGFSDIFAVGFRRGEVAASGSPDT